MSKLTQLPIVPPPGVVCTESERTAQGRWIRPMEKVRFVKGLPQKIGGNVRITNTAMSGTPRCTHAWRDFNANGYIASGTYRKLYAFDTGNVLNDITPLRKQGTLPLNPFTTSLGSQTVTVHDPAHGCITGDTAIYSGAAAVGGLTIDGAYVVQSVFLNDYTITAASAATSTATGGGAVVNFQYEINVGYELGAFGYGWGVGPWGAETWGTARSSSTVFFEPRVWTMDSFGIDLLATYNGGTLWSFDPTHYPWGRAVTTINGVPMNAPNDFRAMFVSPERYVFGLCDKMVVKVCSQADPTQWSPATDNTAFQRTLQEGSKLVGGKALAPFISLVWSDAALYIFQYTGSQFVYNSSLAGRDCGLISPNAVITVDGVAYWMGPDNFYFYSGQVQALPNVEDIRRYVFDSIPANLQFQCTAIFVPKFREIWWFYPTTGASNPTNYVIYHINDQCWSIGTGDFYSSVGVTAGRASGHHYTQGDTSPVMAGTDGFLYNHDPVGDTYNDNGNPLTWRLSLSPYALAEGMQSMDVEAILLDLFNDTGTVTVTVNTYDRINDAAPMDTETETWAAADNPYTEFRLSGRYVGMTVSCGDLNNYFRWGRPVAFVRPSGKRS